MTKLTMVAVVLLILSFAGFGLFYLSNNQKTSSPFTSLNTNQTNPGQNDDSGGIKEVIHPLSIAALRAGDYPGSDLMVEQTLSPGSNYSRQIVSYKSEGLKIYALLTIPNGTPPEGGWPAIVFNHGFIPPAEYRTTERYIAYTDAFSRNGYVMLRPDYRGHGNSEGEASGGYGSNSYTIDVLNAFSSLKKYPNVNTQKMGMWGHSMGGFITLRSMVVNKDIKAGVIWGGVVASYEDLFSKWRRPQNPSASPNTRGGGWRQTLTAQYGTPEQNPQFWKGLSSNTYLQDISGPVQLHHGSNDSSVPVEFSTILDSQLKAVGKEVETFTYTGDDHDITTNFGIAMNRSVAFFDKYLKN
jgi:dipeptidyl aminopeptidase/acylaminoacyl peptidase